MACPSLQPLGARTRSRARGDPASQPRQLWGSVTAPAAGTEASRGSPRAQLPSRAAAASCSVCWMLVSRCDTRQSHSVSPGTCAGAGPKVRLFSVTLRSISANYAPECHVILLGDDLTFPCCLRCSSTTKIQTPKV